MNRTVETLWFAFSFSTAAALLTNCSGGAGSQGSGFPQTVGVSAAGPAVPMLGRLTTSVAVRPPVTLYRDTRTSWISPDTRAPRLLFASDAGLGDVDIFTLPDFVLKGTITGFSEPQGMCAGIGGTVWVANTGTQQVIQLSRTGHVNNVIDDSYGYPVGCAVNLRNGDVAVFNIFNVSGEGGAYVYSCPSCTPTELTIPEFYFYYFGGYDPKGDLFVDGRSSSGSYALGEIPSGKTSGYVITVKGGSGEIYFPGFVQWYKPDKYVVAADQLCKDQNASCLYWVKISGSQGTIIGETDLENPSGGPICDLVQAELDPVSNKNIVGGDYNYCGSGPSSLNRWLYPAGGIPTNTYDYGSAYATPLGGAISVKSLK
ncbi:MAG: hypothetical protein WCC84_06575 [Candidatus Cybelea sp.]